MAVMLWRGAAPVLRFLCVVLATSALLDAGVRQTRQTSGPAVRRLSEPTPRVVDGFVDAACVDVSADVRVCKAHKTRDDLLQVVLFAGGRVVSRWESGMPVFGLFDIRVADLDADGSDELLITDHVGTSNGMAVTYHRAIIVSRYQTAQRSFITFDLEEFCAECPHGTYVPRGGGVAILVTEWMWGVSSIDPRRPPGNYIVGRWFTYDRGRLRPQPGAIARRYLDSFAEHERHGRPDTPASWFTGVHAQSMACDPALGTGRVIRSRRGAIDSHEQTRDGGSYAVRLQDGSLARLGVGWVPSLPGFEGWESLDGVGLVNDRLVLPRGVSPAVVIGDVGGRDVRIDEYTDGGRTRRVMWVY